jgi:drug/metabolite transporter (DMT)-like permease
MLEPAEFTMTIAAPYTGQPLAARRDLSLLLILLGGACTGFSGIFVRLSEIGTIATGGWRLGIATLVLLPFAASGGAKRFAWRPSPILLLAGLFFAVDMCFYHWSLNLTSIAHSTLIVNLAPLFALSAGFMFFGERLGAAKLFGLAASLGGAFLMTAMRADAAGTLTGNGLAALGMIGYSLYLIAVKQARVKHDTLSIMVWSSATCAAAMFAVALAAGEQIVPGTVEGWAIVIALGVVAHVFGQGLVAFGMRTAPVGLASILLLVQPVVAAIAAWIIFGETLGALEMAGAMMVLAGLAMATRARG